MREAIKVRNEMSAPRSIIPCWISKMMGAVFPLCA